MGLGHENEFGRKANDLSEHERLSAFNQILSNSGLLSNAAGDNMNRNVRHRWLAVTLRLAMYSPGSLFHTLSMEAHLAKTQRMNSAEL